MQKRNNQRNVEIQMIGIYFKLMVILYIEIQKKESPMQCRNINSFFKKILKKPLNS